MLKSVLKAQFKTNVYPVKLVTISSGNGLLPVQCIAISWKNANLLY